MRGNGGRVLGFATALLLVATLGWVLGGHAASPPRHGLPTDWSHHHLIFSRPATRSQLERVARDPRYWQQLFRRGVPRTLAQAESSSMASSSALRRVRNPRMRRDWGQSLGNGGTLGAGVFPAKYALGIETASCSDFVVYTTSQFSSTQASVVAYTNLYSGGCSGTVPTVNWAYNTGGFAITSPVLSLDGSQVAFVQTDGAGHGTVVLLKWAASATETVANPTTLSAVGHSAYATCATPPCMTTFNLRNTSGVRTDDSTSSVFYDYGSDTAWVGDGSGFLHKFTPFFNGTPAEIISATAPVWPLLLNPGNTNALSSPVFDPVSNNVFVGDYGGFFYSVSNGASNTITKSAQLDFGTGLVLAPIVDSTSGEVYIFSSNDNTGCGVIGCAAVYQLPTTFSAGASGSHVTVGTGSIASPDDLYQGAFDNAYVNSPGTGNLYVCGNPGGIPALYQIPISSSTMGTPVAGQGLSSAGTACSTVTDISNPNISGGTTEWLFVGVDGHGLGSCGTGGCLMNFKDTPWVASQAYTAGQEVLDTNFQIQVVNVAGTSGTSRPSWSTTVGGATTDGGVTWYNQGPISPAPAAWKASTAYALGNVVYDSNTPPDLELCTQAGTSLSSAPAWSTTLGGITSESGGPQWTNEGPLASFGLASAGGAGGTIIDNVVGGGTLAGASEVYFSTLGNQSCNGTSNVGCAIQASQPALQ